MTESKSKRLLVHDKKTSGRLSARKPFGVTSLALFVVLATTAILLMVSQSAFAATYKVQLTWNNPSDGTADVTPGQWYTYTVDVENTGENFGEDINLTATFTDPNKVAEGWSVSPALLQFHLDGNDIQTKQIKIRPPGNASYEDDAQVYVRTEVQGHESEEGAKATVTLYANVIQVYGVTNNVKNQDNIHDVADGDNTVFTLNITNKGNGKDSFDMSYSGLPLGWPTPSFSTNSISDLPSNEISEVTFQVNVPLNSESTSYTLSTIATSQGNPSKSSTASVTVQVIPKYKVGLEASPSSSNGNPSDQKDYLITIENKGNIAEDFTITYTVIEGPSWSKAINIGPNPTLEYLENLTFTLTVTIGSDAIDSDFNRVQVTVFSQTDPTKNSTVILTTNVNQVYGVSVSSPTKQTVDPGNTLYYHVNVRNTGNGEDTINIETSGAFGGGTSNETILVDMQPDEIRSINVTVNVDNNAPAGIQEITVTGTSDSNPATSDYGTIQVDVNERYEISIASNGPSYQSGFPGGAPVVYQIRVKNEGTGNDDILLDVAGQKPTWATLSPTVINDLAPGEFVVVFVNVTIQPGEKVNVWFINVTGSSSGDNTSVASVALRIDVEQIYDVSITADDNANSIPSNSVTYYEVTVKNRGTGYDDFIIGLLADNPEASTWGAKSPGSFGLHSGQEQIVNISVDVPLGTNPGIFNIWVNVTSINDTDVVEWLLTITEVTQTYNLLISSGSEDSGESPPKSTISYIIEIRNTGSGEDSFGVETIDSQSNHPSWANMSENYIEKLASGEAFLLTVDIEIPEFPPEGDTEDHVLIRIYSINDTATFPAEAFVWLNTTITPERDAILTPHADIFDREPGDVIVVKIQLLNDGTAEDTLTLEDISPAPYDTWGQVQLPATVTLGAGNSTNMTYTITVDPDVTKSESPVKLFLVVKSAGADDEVVEELNVSIRINQTYGVKISTTQNEPPPIDPGQYVVFEIKVKNEGNDNDSFTLKATGLDQDSSGLWEFSEVTLEPNEIQTIQYNVSVQSDHNTTDILITLNASSDGDEGNTYETLLVIVHVNPRYEVFLDDAGGGRKDGVGGEVTQFNLSIKNEGTDIDTFDLDYEAPPGFIVELSTENIQIESVENDALNSTQIISIDVTVRANPPVQVGEYFINVSAVSANDETAVDTFTFIIDVKATRGVSISSQFASKKVPAGDDAEFTGIEVTNKGNDDDDFSFYIIGLPPGWTTNPLSNLNAIAPDGKGSFDLTVTTTEESASGIYQFTLFARSVNDPSKEANVTLTVEVEQIYTIQLPSSVSGKTIDIGDSTTYIISVRNLGNGPDSIELTLSGDVETWTWLYFNATENGTTIHVSPPAGGSIAVILYISPDTDYWDTGDGTVQITIRAESLDDPGITPAFDEVVVTTTINPQYGANIIPVSSVTSGEPAEQKSFLFNIENTGTTTDDYNIRVDDVTGPAGSDTSLWFPNIYFTPSSISNLGDGLSTQVSIIVDIPDPANLYLIPPGGYQITVEVTSGGDSDAKDTEIFTLNVLQVFEADIQNTVNTKDVNVGESVQYSITIKNEGNAMDNLSVELEAGPGETIPGAVGWGTLSHAGTGQVDLASLSDIQLPAGQSTQITLTITIPMKGIDPEYPPTDPDDITLRVIVKPSDEDGVDDDVDVTADINVIYEFDFSFLAETLDVIPESGSNTAEFTLKIENKGTSSETFTYEIFQWEVDWSAYGYSFSPSSITIGASTIDEVTLSITTPTDLKDALSKDYGIIVKVHSNAGSIDIFKNCTIHLEPIYDVDLTVTGSTNKATDVGNILVYQFTVRNTGNSNETYSFTISDMDTSTLGGGDQSTWVKLYLVSDPTTPVTSIELNADESKAMNMEFTVPQQNDFDFGKITDPVQIEIEVLSESEPTITDFFTSTTTINPIYTFVFSTTAPANTKEGKPGDPIPFTLQVRNTGTASDTYEFRITSIDEAVFTPPNPDAISPITNLGVDSTSTTTITILINTEKEHALEGSYDIEITAESTLDASVTEAITIIIDITGDAEVETTPVIQSDSGEPGDVIDYTVKVSNKGNAEDIFDLTLSGQYKDWGRILSTNGTEISSVTLAATTLPGSFTDVIVRVTIPGTGETNADQEYSITIKAASRITEDIDDTSEVKTKVDQFVELHLAYSGSGAASADYNPNKSPPKFSFKVTNNGNVPEDAISVEIDDMPSTWDFTPPTINILDPGKSTTFSITFDIPSDEDDDRDLQVFVTSSDGSFDSEPVFVRINITKPNLFVEDVTGLDNLDTLKSRVGNSVSMVVTVTNGGTAKAESIQVKFYEENNVRGTKTISSIEAGASKTVTFRWSVVADDVELKIEVTPVIETDEGDNEYNFDILDLRPDLAFYGSEKINITTTTPGESATVKAFVRNTGGNAEDVVIKFYEGTKIIGTDTLDIDFDEVGEASVSWDVPDKKGETVEIRAEIDLDGAIGNGDETTRSVKIGDKDDGAIGEIFGTAGLIGMGIGLGIGFILFIIGLAIGRGSAGRRREAAGGPSFAAFEKEEGLGKGAAKGPGAAPAPFGAPPGEEEGEAPPGEEEEGAAAPKEAVRVRCPKCGKVKEVTSTQRPLQIPCECGTTLMLKK